MSYWYVWPIGIVLWVALGWFEFGVLEKKALSDKARSDQITLSMFTYTMFTKFPLSILLTGIVIGLFFGILGTHLLWHWCPAGSVSAG